MLKSEAQGHRFVRRLIEEMSDGRNRFDKEGEALFVAENDGKILGVCGLNQDAMSGRPKTARLRHLFIDPMARGNGVGTALVRTCIDLARQHADLIVLRTYCADASAFYGRIGFRASSLEGATHEMPL